MEINPSEHYIGKFGEYKGETVKVISVSDVQIIFGTKTGVENVIQAHSLPRFYFEEAFASLEEKEEVVKDMFYESLNDTFIEFKSEILKFREKEIINESQAMVVSMLLKTLIQRTLKNRSKYDL